MQCKNCGYSDSRVVRTNKDEKTNQIFRRRECIKCNVRFNTQENLRDVVKQEPYKTQPPKRILDK